MHSNRWSNFTSCEADQEHDGLLTDFSFISIQMFPTIASLPVTIFIRVPKKDNLYVWATWLPSILCVVFQLQSSKQPSIVAAKQIANYMCKITIRLSKQYSSVRCMKNLSILSALCCRLFFLLMEKTDVKKNQKKKLSRLIFGSCDCVIFCLLVCFYVLFLLI